MKKKSNGLSHFWQELKRRRVIHVITVYASAAFEEITNRLEVLALKGMYEPMDMVVMYIYADRPDKAMDWIERGFEVHSHQIPYIATGIYNLDTLYENPRFIAILEKMNLPLPL